MAHNVSKYVDEIHEVDTGDVLLTGSTGFLGAHVLRHLIEKTDKKIYCLLRGSDMDDRLKSILMYYFETPCEELFGSRIFTVSGDITDRETVRAKLLELVVDVGRRFRRERRWARTAKLKIRDSAFNTFTKQMPFDAPARDDISFRERALALFDKTDLKSVRLVGFGVTNIQDSPDDGELSLFAGTDRERPDRRERLSSALDSLRDKGFNV